MDASGGLGGGGGGGGGDRCLRRSGPTSLPAAPTSSLSLTVRRVFRRADHTASAVLCSARETRWAKGQEDGAESRPGERIAFVFVAWCLEACKCVRRSPSQAHSPDTSVAYAERQRRGVAPGAATRSSTQDHAGDESAAGAAGGLDQDVLPRAVSVAWPRWMLPAANGDSGEPASSGRASRHSIYRTENNVSTALKTT